MESNLEKKTLGWFKRKQKREITSKIKTNHEIHALTHSLTHTCIQKRRTTLTQTHNTSRSKRNVNSKPHGENKRTRRKNQNSQSHIHTHPNGNEFKKRAPVSPILLISCIPKPGARADQGRLRTRHWKFRADENSRPWKKVNKHKTGKEARFELLKKNKNRRLESNPETFFFNFPSF